MTPVPRPDMACLESADPTQLADQSHFPPPPVAAVVQIDWGGFRLGHNPWLGISRRGLEGGSQVVDWRGGIALTLIQWADGVRVGREHERVALALALAMTLAGGTGLLPASGWK